MGRADLQLHSDLGDGLSPSQWVGLHNFRVLWGDPIFLRALRNNAERAQEKQLEFCLFQTTCEASSSWPKLT